MTRRLDLVSSRDFRLVTGPRFACSAAPSGLGGALRGSYRDSFGGESVMTNCAITRRGISVIHPCLRATSRNGIPGVCNHGCGEHAFASTSLLVVSTAARPT